MILAIASKSCEFWKFSANACDVQNMIINVEMCSLRLLQPKLGKVKINFDKCKDSKIDFSKLAKTLSENRRTVQLLRAWWSRLTKAVQLAANSILRDQEERWKKFLTEIYFFKDKKIGFIGSKMFHIQKKTLGSMKFVYSVCFSSVAVTEWPMKVAKAKGQYSHC